MTGSKRKTFGCLRFALDLAQLLVRFTNDWSIKVSYVLLVRCHCVVYSLGGSATVPRASKYRWLRVTYGEVVIKLGGFVCYVVLEVHTGESLECLLVLG